MLNLFVDKLYSRLPQAFSKVCLTIGLESGGSSSSRLGMANELVPTIRDWSVVLYDPGVPLLSMQR